jgi:hypothetical protein
VSEPKCLGGCAAAAERFGFVLDCCGSFHSDDEAGCVQLGDFAEEGVDWFEVCCKTRIACEAAVAKARREATR